MEPKDIRVLLADDNPDILKIMTIFLEREGYTAVGVSNGIDALVALREQEFHLIILDIMMPGLTGIETCRRVREYTHAPILFVTAKSKEQAQLSAYESGGDDYLTKPFSKEGISRTGAGAASPICGLPKKRLQRGRQKQHHLSAAGAAGN